MTFEENNSDLDISSEPLDLRFTLSLSDQTIREQGKSLILVNNANENENWLQQLDRKKLVSFSIACFKRILDILQISNEDIRYIMKIRNIENKRVSTKYNRRKIALQEIQKLKTDKKSLVDMKQKLQVEIEYYTRQLAQIQDDTCIKDYPEEMYEWN